MDSLARAKELEKQGNKKESAELYLKAINETEEVWPAAKAGELFLEVGEIQKAKKAYNLILGCENHLLYDHLINFYLKIEEYEEASDIFMTCYPYAPHSKKIAFADKLFQLKAFEEAEMWYLNSIDNVYQDKNPYFKKVGEHNEKFGFLSSKSLSKADDYYFHSEFKSALTLYSRLAKNSDYAKIKSAECAFMLKDFEKAKVYYRELVQATDDAYLMFMLAECYNSEDIDTNTLENAVYWYEYALEQGCELCYYHLGICYEFGRGTDENIEKALEMYRRGASLEVDKANCLCKLGNYYYKNNEPEKATEYYKQAAELGNQRALLNIAIAYFESEIPYFSYEEIKCFLAKAAALGSKRAYDMLITAKQVNETT